MVVGIMGSVMDVNFGWAILDGLGYIVKIVLVLRSLVRRLL